MHITEARDRTCLWNCIHNIHTDWHWQSWIQRAELFDKRSSGHRSSGGVVQETWSYVRPSLSPLCASVDMADTCSTGRAGSRPLYRSQYSAASFLSTINRRLISKYFDQQASEHFDARSDSSVNIFTFWISDGLMDVYEIMSALQQPSNFGFCGTKLATKHCLSFIYVSLQLLRNKQMLLVKVHWNYSFISDQVWFGAEMNWFADVHPQTLNKTKKWPLSWINIC